MRILQINNCHYRRGGADIVYLNTGKLLENNGHEVIYFSQEAKDNIEGNSSKYFIKNINYFERSIFKKILLVPRFFYSREAKIRLTKLINNLSPEIAHIHLYKSVLTPSILKVLKKNNIPTIITLHDYGMLCPHNIMLDGKMNPCNRCIKGSPLNCILHKCNRNKFILSCVSSFEYIFQNYFFPPAKYFHTIIAVSKYTRSVHRESELNLPPIIHLYNFYINLDSAQPNNIKGKYFLFYGRLSREKGIMTLLSAWTNKERKSVLKIVGMGEMYEELKLIACNNISIEVLGYKSGEDLNALIKNASFVLVPSEVYENNPLTIIEAYANGKPVIASNIGGIPEIIDEGNTGYLFDMKSVKSLSEKIDLAEAINEYDYNRLSKNARKYADEHFSEKIHYNALISIYKSIVIDYHNY